MTQQKSEGRVVPEGRRKAVPTRPREGGKAIPVEEAEPQLSMGFATAEIPRQRGAEGMARADRSARTTQKVPKAKDTRRQVVPATMEKVVEQLAAALDKVVANKGASGPDRQTVDEVREHWPTIHRTLSAALLEGSYLPGEIRRVWIPKAGGGQRGLGIPNVVDRVVQEAVRSVLEPMYEPTFHASSHGFRPNRSCHTAIAEACSHVREGFAWVVDIDLEKFFDRVHHQRLLSRLAERVTDSRLLALIGRMLKAAVVMPEGVRVHTEEGVPQGGPLSPLLSNIVLSELDEELARRSHRFVRYADDCNIYVRSERAGERVMASVTRFIDRRLRLRVNADKSAVARPETRHFLGFRLRPHVGDEPEVLLSERSVKRLKERIRELTPRARGQSLATVIGEINRYLEGWLGFFGVCTRGVSQVVGSVDAHIRRRLRALILRHWKTKRTIARRLIRLGVRRQKVWDRIYEGRQSLWALSHSSVVDRGLRNAYFAEQGLVSLQARLASTWSTIVAPAQLELTWGSKRS